MNPNFKLAPSILSADFSNLKSALDICNQGGAHWIHVDVMDNQFVPNLTIGPPVVKSLRTKTQKFIDVHMMVINPEKLVEPFAKAVNESGTDRRLIFTALQETFLTYLKVSFFAAFFAIFSFTSSSTKISLVFLLIKIGNGTPQTLCLDTHQSGLVSIIDLSLSFPLLG